MYDTGTNRVTSQQLERMLATVFQTPKLEFQTVMVWGAPGTGKTAITHQQADAASGPMIPLHLFMRESVDMRGMPDIDRAARRTFWTTPDFFPQDPDAPPPVVFLDEITAADFGVQAVAYQIAYEHRVGEHALPPGTRVLMAGNRLGDGAVAYTMSTALANRAVHVTLQPNAKQWLAWGMGKLHETVLGFISFKSQFLYEYDPNAADPAFPTPRTWESVSQQAQAVDAGEMDSDLLPLFVKGSVGENVGSEYMMYRQVYSQLKSLKDYIDGEALPRDIGLMHAISMQAAESVRNGTQSINDVLGLILRPDFLDEFAVIVASQLMEIDIVTLTRQPIYPEFSRQYGHLLI